MSNYSVSLSSDVQLKYQKIVVEYNKLKSHAKVLRNGVLIEREKVEKLTEELKSKDALIRKLEAEKDGLIYRNQQLSIIVEGQGDYKGNCTNDARKYDITLMMKKIESLERDLNSMNIENQKLESELANIQSIHKQELEDFAQKLESSKEQSLTSTNVEIKEKNLDDLIDDRDELKFSDNILLDLTKVAVNILNNFYNVFNLLKVRSELYPYDSSLEILPEFVVELSEKYGQMSKLFCDVRDYLEKVIEKQFINKTTDFAKIDSIFKEISNGNNSTKKIEYLVELMCKEENKSNWCTKQLADFNNHWVESMARLLNGFHVVSDCFSCYEIDDIVKKLEGFLHTCSEMSNIYFKRWRIEKNLPATTKRFKSVGEALESAFALLTKDIRKFIDEIKISKMSISAKFYNDNLKCVKDTNCSNDIVEKFVEEEKVMDERKESDEFVLKEHLSEIEFLRQKVIELATERDRLNVDISLMKKKLGQSQNCFDVNEVDQIREIGIERTNEMIKHMLKSQCSSEFYKKECEILLTMIICLKQQYEEYKNRFNAISDENEKIQDELSSVRKEYELKIIELSDHAAMLTKPHKIDLKRKT